MAELRKDPVAGNWIVTEYKGTESNSVGVCPFCPGNEHLTPKAIREYKDDDGSWLIRCFPTANPVFVIEAVENKRAEGLYDKMDNVGAHEIIVENRSHTKTMSNFTDKELLLLLEVYMERISDLKKDKRFKSIQVFKNHGELADSHLFHPHSHLLATPMMAARLELEVLNSKNYYQQKERCLLCDIISQEIKQNKRVVSINSGFIAICPFASRFPFEVWILPRIHSESFEQMLKLKDDMKLQLVNLVLDIMKRIEKLTNSYTLVIHTSPNTGKTDFQKETLPVSEYFHWHIEILPMDKKSSKYKREDEFYVTAMTPEEAAKTLKEQAI
jgi:UDPglucose--hexose-1-phosphate uridylyltransferase